MNQDMEIALLSKENVELKQRIHLLEFHIRTLVRNLPDPATMTLTIDSPWLREARRLVS